MNLSPEINEIRKKMATTGWPKQVIHIGIEGIHGLINHKISFNNFPVCAIVGENGTGKSTILKALALAYKNETRRSYFPSDFFPDTIWDSLAGINFTFQIKQGQDVIKTHRITKPTQRWRGFDKRMSNNVFFFDLGRIQATESLAGYSKLTKTTIKELASRNLLPESIGNISEVMGRKYLSGRYAKTTGDNSRGVGILKFDFGDVSQFHQGTGESVVFDLIGTIENIPNYSLVIVDEIESSLHPKAQRRLIRQLLHLARIKTLQIVFSTHSPYVLSELPQEARILLTRLNEDIQIFYGPTVDFCLSQIDDKLHYEIDVFVEDDESKEIVSEIIRATKPEMLERIRISPVGSASVIQMLENLYSTGKFPVKLIGIIDAEQKEMKSITKLPGNFSPEKQLILDISLNKLHGRIAEFLNIDESKICKEFEEVQLIQNYHDWIKILAEKLNISSSTLFNCLSLLWVRNCVKKEEAEKISTAILERLEKDVRPRNSGTNSI